MKSITSAANPSYKAWLRLATHPREVRTTCRTLAEGAHLAQAALEAGASIEAVITRAGSRGVEFDALLAQLAMRDCPQYELASALYDALGLVENGIGLTLLLTVPPADAGPITGDALFLDGLQDPGNVGALMRVAAAAGVRHVLAAPGTAALWAPKVLRAAQGAHFRLDLRERVAADRLPELPLHWIGTDVAAGESLWQVALPSGPVGWVLGAEGQGATAQALAACARRIRIPLASGIESLNVATAAAVCLFERQRRLLG